MWWTLFAVADLYIGVIVLDAMAPTLPPEKLPRVRTVRNVLLGLTAVGAVVFLLQMARHYGWIRF